jgi:hypothetical protein
MLNALKVQRRSGGPQPEEQANKDFRAMRHYPESPPAHHDRNRMQLLLVASSSLVTSTTLAHGFERIGGQVQGHPLPGRMSREPGAIDPSPRMQGQRACSETQFKFGLRSQLPVTATSSGNHGRGWRRQFPAPWASLQGQYCTSSRQNTIVDSNKMLFIALP